MIKKLIKNVFGSDNRSYKENDVKESDVKKSDVITNIEKGYLYKVNDFIEVAFSRFNGEKNVYIDFENGHVGKESDTLSLVRLNHEIERDKPIYVIFERKRTKEEYLWKGGNSYYHFSCCITEWGISLAATLKNNVNGKKRIWRISWDDIEKTAVEKCISDDICKSHALAGDFAWEAYEVKLRVIKIYKKDGDYINFPICYVSNYVNFADAVNEFLELRNNENKENILGIKRLFEQNDYEGVLRIMEENNLWDSSIYYHQYIGIICLLKLDRKLEADRRFLAFEKVFLSIDEKNINNKSKKYYLDVKASMEEYERNMLERLFEQNDYEGVLRIMEENNLWDSSNYHCQYTGIICLLKLDRKLEADRRFLAFEKDFLSIDEKKYMWRTGDYDCLRNYQLDVKASMEEYERNMLERLFAQNDYEGVLRIMEENNLWDSSNYYYQYVGIICLLKLDRKLEADRRLLAFEKVFLSIDEKKHGRGSNDDYDCLRNYYFSAKSAVEVYEQKWYDASVTMSLAKELGALSDEIGAKKGIEENYTKYVQNFETLPYQERKVITMTNTDHLFKSDNLTLLWMNNLPAEIKFPITHPKKDHTYICHPYDDRLYLPIEDYEEVLLNDRINEYCYLMQCLGATTIRIQNKKEESLNEHRESARNIHGEGSYKILEASGNYETNSKKGEGRNSKYTFAREQHFNPSKKPYIPDGLIWFPHEVSWQRLATQRMSGGILKYSESVSSSENRVVTSNELQDINAEVKALFAKMKGGIKRESNYEISMNEDQEWEIFVEFKPIEEFDASVDFSDIAETVQIEEVEELPESIFTEEEKQYMDEVRYMLEDDDKIDEKESRLLERFRQKFNLSEDRANELKNILLSAVDLNSQELEYLKEYETFIQDGEIKERERRLLNRVANLLGISEDRALEIENKYNIKNQ